MSNSRSSSRSICSCGNPSCRKYAEVKKQGSKSSCEKKVYYVCKCKGGKCGCYYRKEGEYAWKSMTVKPHSKKKSNSSASTHKPNRSHHSSHSSHEKKHYSCECHGSRCKCGRVHEKHETKPVTLYKQASMFAYPQAASVTPYSHYGWYSGCACHGRHCHC